MQGLDRQVFFNDQADPRPAQTDHATGSPFKALNHEPGFARVVRPSISLRPLLAEEQYRKGRRPAQAIFDLRIDAWYANEEEAITRSWLRDHEAADARTT
jgi:hypothetical protein